jgi:hypothetical protein
MSSRDTFVGMRRAAAVSPGFAPQGDELLAVAELARRLTASPSRSSWPPCG